MLFVQHLLNGLLAGAYYLLIALGLSLIFSLGGIVNLAHGAFGSSLWGSGRVGSESTVDAGDGAGFHVGPACCSYHRICDRSRWLAP